MREAKTATCSCVILNFNDYDTTSELVKNISDYSVFTKIIVIDNCSTDDSYEKLKKLENKKIQVSMSKKNGGYGYGNNYGVRIAAQKYNSDFVLIVNPDVVFTEKMVLALCKAMGEGVAAASCIQLDYKRKEINSIAWQCPTYSEYVFSSLFFCSKFIHIKTFNKDNYLGTNSVATVDCVPGSLLLVDTKLFLEVGGYDEDIFLYCEESTLGNKLKSKGYKTHLLLNQYYVHNHSVSINKTIKNTITQRRILYNSRLIYIKKYLKASDFECLFASAVYKIALAEERIKEGIKRATRRNQ